MFFHLESSFFSVDVSLVSELTELLLYIRPRQSSSFIAHQPSHITYSIDSSSPHQRTHTPFNGHSPGKPRLVRFPLTLRQLYLVPPNSTKRLSKSMTNSPEKFSVRVLSQQQQQQQQHSLIMAKFHYSDLVCQ